MRASGIAAAFLCTAGLLAAPVFAQQGRPPMPPASNQPPTLTSVLQTQLTVVEYEIVGAAQAMPEDKYSFAPTNGEFKGVRTFAQQVKHIGTINNRFFGAILGQPASPNQGEADNGPDSIQTKDQIIQYLKDSFALGHNAIATINADNAFTPLPGAGGPPFLNTRTSLAIFACVHAMDHYGQMVEYLRDNGIIPPASAQRPPANPPKPSGE